MIKRSIEPVSYTHLDVYKRQESDRSGSSSELPVSVTIGVTPILLDQLDDDYMREGFIKWTQARIKRARCV